MASEMVRADGTHVCGIILAAGLSRRFGSDKLLHLLSGKPVFSWVLQSACESSLDGVVIVGRPELLARVPPTPNVRTVVNPAPEIGQSTSIRIGLSALLDQSTHVLILLADQPLITPSLIDEYVNLANHGSMLACLGSDDYFGPPALFGKKWFEHLKDIQGDTGARRILLNERKELQIVKAQFRGQEKDIDLKENLPSIEQSMHKFQGFISPSKTLQ